MALNDTAVLELIVSADCDQFCSESTTGAQQSPVALHYLHHTFVGSFGLYYWSDKGRYEGTSYLDGVECRTLPLNTPDRKLFIASSAVYLILSTGIVLQRFQAVSRSLRRISKLRHMLATILGCCFIPFFIIMMEDMIRSSRDAIQDTEENSWSYGQILALVTALLSVLMLLGEIARIPRVFKTAGTDVTRSDIEVPTSTNTLFDLKSGIRPENWTVNSPGVKPKRTMTALAIMIWHAHTSQAM
uniref:Uncharacterized protein n=1 Tax=Moniliophthora roreri TaxID=221103 RepID=A0A0W0FDS0_MONRR